MRRSTMVPKRLYFSSSSVICIGVQCNRRICTPDFFLRTPVEYPQSKKDRTCVYFYLHIPARTLCPENCVRGGPGRHQTWLGGLVRRPKHHPSISAQRKTTPAHTKPPPQRKNSTRHDFQKAVQTRSV
ncbi:hypothetical protein TWF730_008094 [Orbilia blumenaviensis]|uniref:Secreted protein n=1 Tax=Orbilia blumenaviensis TaxID=1796055 RepID=A0AAV9VA11_9PEZI